MAQMSKITAIVGEHWPAHIANVPPPHPIRERMQARGIEECRLVLEIREGERFYRAVAAYEMDGAAALPECDVTTPDPQGITSQEHGARLLMRYLLLEWLCRALSRPRRVRPELLQEVVLADQVVWVLGESYPGGRARQRVVGSRTWQEPDSDIVQRETVVTWNEDQDPKGRLLLVPTSALELLH